MTYQMLDLSDVVIPEWVLQSDKYRFLRRDLAMARVGQRVFILPEEQSESGINAVRMACYKFPELTGTPDVKVRTKLLKVNGHLPDDLSQVLHDRGINDGQTIIIAVKERVQPA